MDQSREREMLVFCAIYVGSVAANFQCCTQLCNISVRDCKAVIPSRSIPVAFSIPKIPVPGFWDWKRGLELLNWLEKILINNHNNCSFAQYYLQQHAWQIICMAFVYFFALFRQRSSKKSFISNPRIAKTSLGLQSLISIPLYLIMWQV